VVKRSEAAKESYFPHCISFAPSPSRFSQGPKPHFL
jgi:hypothetical protein